MPKSVHVIDPVAINRIRLAATLETGQYDVTTSATVEALMRGGTEPDLVVLGLGEDAPGAALGALRHSAAPVLALDDDPTPLRRLTALRTGAREVLPRRLPDALLLARLRGLIRDGEAEREGERRRITAASFGFAEAPARFDDGERIVLIDPGGDAPGLPALLPGVEPASIDTALRDAGEAGAPDAFVVVSGDRPGTLDRILPEVRDRSHAQYCPVMVVHPADRLDIATHALDLGAAEIASDTALGEELEMRVEAMLARKRRRDRLRRCEEQSYRLAATDPLTGLYNRRYSEAYLGDLMLRAGEGGRGFVVLLIDLDHFKAVNDRFGHAAGDEVLREVAFRLRDNLRACDLISRHGGEEFLAILPDTSLEQAMQTADRLCRAVSCRPVVTGDGTALTVTASIGAATGEVASVSAARTGTFDAPERLLPDLGGIIAAADSALYRAKQAGRNRVVLSA